MEYNLNNSYVSVKAMLLEIERLENDFLILNKSDKEYIQVMPLGNNYTVEIRLITINNLVRQYRVGINPSSKIWNYTYNPIALKQSEFLKKDDVKRIVKDYINGEELFELFYKRNISKEIGLM